MCRALFSSVAFLALLLHFSHGYASQPRVEDKPLLLDSYLPASMQIIAHLTDLMKYELRPGGSAVSTTTSTTPRPTPAHKPGVFAPSKPPGPQAYFSRKRQVENEEFEERSLYPTLNDAEIQSLQNILAQLQFEKSETSNLRMQKNLPFIPDLELLGKNFDSLFYEANRIDEENKNNQKTEDEKTEDFLKKYDDSKFSLTLLKQKRIPPTRAYVGLLSLYDALNKNTKALGLNKYGGFSDAVLKVLISTSSGTSAEQLKTVFRKIVERKDTKDPDILKRMNTMLADMATDKSYLNDAMRDIPPLQFTS